MRHKPLCYVLPVLLALLLTLSGCIYDYGAPTCSGLSIAEHRAGQLPVESLLSAMASTGGLEWYPAIYVLNRTEDASEFEALFAERLGPITSERMEAAMVQADFDTHIIIVASLGLKDSGGHSFCVTSMNIEGYELVLNSHYIPSWVSSAATTTYYTLIQIPLDLFEEGEYTLRLHLTEHEIYVREVYPSSPPIRMRTSQPIDRGIVATTTVEIPLR